MKSWKTIKKVLPFLGIGIASVAIITTTSISLNNDNNTTSTKTCSTQNLNNKEVKEIKLDQPTDLIENKKTTSIEENEIIQAIDSFEDNKSIDNLNRAYKFNNQGMTSEESLITLVQENIKYYSLDTNDNNLYTLPRSSIFISANIGSDSFNVYIDLSLINGYVSYYSGNMCVKNNVDNGITYQNNYTPEIITKTDAISFNAINTTKNIDYEDNSEKMLNILYLISIIFGGIGVLLIILLIYRKISANKKFVHSSF